MNEAAAAGGGDPHAAEQRYIDGLYRRLAELRFDYVLFPPPGKRAGTLYDKEGLGGEAIDGGYLVF